MHAVTCPLYVLCIGTGLTVKHHRGGQEILPPLDQDLKYDFNFQQFRYIPLRKLLPVSLVDSIMRWLVCSISYVERRNSKRNHCYKLDRLGYVQRLLDMVWDQDRIDNVTFQRPLILHRAETKWPALPGIETHDSGYNCLCSSHWATTPTNNHSLVTTPIVSWHCVFGHSPFHRT